MDKIQQIQDFMTIYAGYSSDSTMPIGEKWEKQNDLAKRIDALYSSTPKELEAIMIERNNWQALAISREQEINRLKAELKAGNQLYAELTDKYNDARADERKTLKEVGEWLDKNTGNNIPQSVGYLIAQLKSGHFKE